MNESCYLQNLIDLDPSQQVLDTFCGGASYDGHKGIDIRVPNLTDMNRGFAVLAIAEGTVVATRDGVADRLVFDAQSLAAVAGRECGNGVVIRHEGGYTSQYCHMFRGSVRVKEGETVQRGEPIGLIGASGHTQFPHLHLTVRRNGNVIDPMTGLEAAPEHCNAPVAVEDGAVPFGSFSYEMIRSREAIIQVGLAEDRFELGDLVYDRLPNAPTGRSSRMIGYGWAINMKAGDRMRVLVTGPDGIFAEHMSEPRPRHQAAYFAFAGKARSPEPGAYEVLIEIIRDGEAVVRRRERAFVEP
ncbi:MAG: M23 family metallopeptidase [Pseudomonadota bacterium]